MTEWPGRSGHWAQGELRPSVPRPVNSARSSAILPTPKASLACFLGCALPCVQFSPWAPTDSIPAVMTATGIILLSLSAGLLLYTYIGYSLVLKAISVMRRRRSPPVTTPERWPMISITVPMYNEEAEAAALIESLLALEYPEDRRQILI